MYKKLLKKIPNNSRLAIFGTNKTSAKIYDEIKNNRKDVEFKFFMSSSPNGDFLGFPVENFLKWQNYKEIDCIIIATYSQRYLISTIIKGHTNKKLIFIDKAHIVDVNSQKQIKRKLISLEEVDDGKLLTFFGFQFKVLSRKKIDNMLAKQLWSDYRRFYLNINFLKFILSTCDITTCKTTNQNFKLLQNVRKNVLKKIADIFDKNNLVYWLDFGTLLGAYRHKGFIPWDDDLDIAMKREDYYKAKKLLEEEFKDSEYKVHIGDCGYSMIIRVADRKTNFTYFDIFPYDYSDNSDISSLELCDRLIKSKNEFFEKFPKKDYYAGKYKLEDKLNDVYEIYQKNGVSNLNNSGKYLFRAVDSLSHTPEGYNSVHLTENIFPLKKIQFEEFEFSCPNNVVEYLKETENGSYGDFMAFPVSSWSRNVFEMAENPSTLRFLKEKIIEFQK